MGPPPPMMTSPRSSEELGTIGVLVGVGVGEEGVAAAVFDEAEVWSVSQTSQVGVPSMLGVMSVGSPLPLAGTTQMSPPVEPWSDMRPPMKAMCLPSGEKRGTAIWRPWRADCGGVGVEDGRAAGRGRLVGVRVWTGAA